MSLEKCAECGKEVSTKAKFCPHCGAECLSSEITRSTIFGGCLKVVFWLVAVFLILIWFTDGFKSNNPVQTKTVTRSVNYPSLQLSFHELNRPFPVKYDHSRNEIQKSRVFTECNEARGKFGVDHGRGFENWVGQIHDLSTDQGGDIAWLTIRSLAAGFQIDYKTLSSEFSDPFKETLIKKGSRLYKQLSKLSEGESVRFSGRFIASDERGLLEISMTEYGCISEPEFVVHFTSIHRY